MVYLYYFIIQIVIYALFELIWFLFDKENGEKFSDRIKLFIKKSIDMIKKVKYRIKEVLYKANKELYI